MNQMPFFLCFLVLKYLQSVFYKVWVYGKKHMKSGTILLVYLIVPTRFVLLWTESSLKQINLWGGKITQTKKADSETPTYPDFVGTLYFIL